MEAQDSIVNVIALQGKGHLEKFEQELALQYIKGNGNLKDFVRLKLSTTNPDERKPRSFGTNNPETLRKLIKKLCVCLYQLEEADKQYKLTLKGRVNESKGLCPRCGSNEYNTEAPSDQDKKDGKVYCVKCGNIYKKLVRLNY